MTLFAKQRNVAVVGTYNSGKTVLLTSLINHLLHHDPQRFNLGRDVQIRGAEVLETSNEPPKFDYEKYRMQLVKDASWPRKTDTASQLQLRLDMSSSWVSVDLKFLDFPGELVADAGMASMNFKEWSAWTLSRIQRLPPELSELYHKSIAECKNPQEEIQIYKRLMAQCRKAFLPFISPSSFVLNSTEGLINSHESIEKLVATRSSGLDKLEFAPQHSKEGQKSSEEWSKNYEKYKKTVVTPLLRNLRSCDTLVIVVDIPTILNAGHGMGNDTIDMLREVLRFCDPGVNILEKAYRWSGLPEIWRGAQSSLGWSALNDIPLLGDILQGLERSLGQSKISRIAMVASKCDLVHEDDRDTLCALLRQLFQSVMSRYGQVDLRWFAISAALSTRSSVERHSLYGIPASSVAMEECEVSVDVLPSTWPEQWQQGDFAFADFKPRRFAGLQVQAPPQAGLDDLARFILELD